MNSFAGVTIEEKTVGNNVIFSIAGEIVIANAEKMQSRVLEKAGGEEIDVILDLRGVPYIDSFGRGALVQINNVLEKKDRRLLILMNDGHVKEELDICRLSSFMNITTDARVLGDAA